eukprot:2152380-Amphidinium_carterae.1
MFLKTGVLKMHILTDVEHIKFHTIVNPKPSTAQKFFRTYFSLPLPLPIWYPPNYRENGSTALRST